MPIRLYCIGWVLMASLEASPLEEWRREIELRTGGRIAVVPVHTDPERNEMRLPEDLDAARIARRYLADDSFRRELTLAQALTINHRGPEGEIHLILLNMALADQWKGAEEGLLAHEVGHIWLDAMGLRAPAFQPGPRACIGIHAGDIPQHVLIRAEAERRGISTRPHLLGNLRMALAALESGKATRDPPPCARLALLSQILDARVGVTAEQWDERSRFLQLFESAYPEVASQAPAIEERLRLADLTDREQLEAVTEFVRRQLERLFESPERIRTPAPPAATPPPIP